MDAPDRIFAWEQRDTIGTSRGWNTRLSYDAQEYIRADLCADPALLAEAVDVIRRLESAYTSHLFNSKGDFYEPGREPEVIAARAFLSKLENRHE